MGTQAHWFSAPWRYREEDALGWTYADTLADVKEDVGDPPDVPVTIQKRQGRKREGYTYVDHSVIGG